MDGALAGRSLRSRWRCAVDLALLLVPTSGAAYEQSVLVNSREISHTSSSSSETFLQQVSLDAALVLVPIALTVLPLLLRHPPWVIHVRGIALIGLVLILPAGYFTMGGFYLPSAIAMLGAIVRDRVDRGVVPV